MAAPAEDIPPKQEDEDEIKDDEEEELGLDDEDDSAVVKFKAKEGTIFTVSTKAALRSKFVQTALQENESDQVEIPLFHIEEKIVQKLVDYLNYHEKVEPKRIPKPLTSSTMADMVDEWDASFCDCDQETMFKTLLAANYMHINDLLMLMCAKVASMMKGKTPEEIRDIFNVRKDFTPEEEENVRKEYKDLLE